MNKENVSMDTVVNLLQKHVQPFGQNLWDRLTNKIVFQEQTIESKGYTVLLFLFAVAVLPFLPYTYFITLRVLASIILVVFFMQLKDKGFEIMHPVQISLVGLIALYNPIIPVSLGVHIIWTIVNVMTLYYLYRLLPLFTTDKTSEESDEKQESIEAK